MEQQTQNADPDFDLFEDESEEGSKTDAGNGGELTLSELNSISGRNFSTKEEALKHYQHLNSMVGDQKRVEQERKAKEAEEKLTENLSELEKVQKEVADLRKENQKKEFLLANPTAKDKFELLEAYADKNNLSIEEAWTKIADKFVSVSSDSEGVRPKQRLTPTNNQNVAQLLESARRGSDTAAEALVAELIVPGLRK